MSGVGVAGSTSIGGTATLVRELLPIETADSAQCPRRSHASLGHPTRGAVARLANAGPALELLFCSELRCS